MPGKSRSKKRAPAKKKLTKAQLSNKLKRAWTKRRKKYGKNGVRG